MEKYVCGECLNDDGLKRFVADNAKSERCDFCDTESDKPMATDLESVGKFMERCLYQDYDDANEELPYETAEGGYQGSTTYDTYDLLTDELQMDLSDGLLAALCGEISDQVWCPKDPFGMSRTDELDFSWSRFCRQVKHESRFFVFVPPGSAPGAAKVDRDELLAPGALLAFVGNAAAAAGAITRFPASTRLFRARRVTNRTEIATPLDLGPPEPQGATQNRMSAAGIPMFYGCDDIDTTLAELGTLPGLYAVGEFWPRHDLLLLDLTALPGVPEVFELGNREERDDMLFLRRFAREVSKPVTAKDLVHIDYVPTQAVTEYFRSVFRHKNQRLDGIAYRSAARPDHRSVVLFATRDDILLSKEDLAKLGTGTKHFFAGVGRERAWLELNAVHWRTVPNA